MSPVERSEAASLPIISVEHVFKSVTDSTGTLSILRDIHFALAARETAAIVGASGAGKSTLAYAVERKLFDMGRAVYVLDGQNLRHDLNKGLPQDRAGRAEKRPLAPNRQTPWR